MKKVLVTGASGFIGRQSLTPLVRRGFEVHAVTTQSQLDESLTGLDVTWHQFDLLEAGTPAVMIQQIQPSHLLHFGWYAEPGKYLESAENMRWVAATLAMLQAFKASEGERFVSAGTCFEYDGAYGFCREDLTPKAPTSLYGTCKDATRAILATYADTEALSLAWGRIFFLYGPYEHPNRLVSSIIRSLLSGQSAKSSAGTQIRDFMHVSDVAEGFVHLLESDVRGSVNICSGQATTIADVARTIAKQLKAEGLLELGALPMRANEPPLLIGDVQRLTNEVGFEPRYNLETGIAAAIDWWRKA
ncbi:MAG: NAD(P)-dependent oxidoreductase [Pseudomonadota bacterium]